MSAGIERIYLAGLPGAGKTTVAERIASWLGHPAHDVDREVERAAGESIAALWEGEGEASFRAAERDAVRRLTATDAPAVLALGGGTLEDGESRARLAEWGVGVWLDAPVAELASRTERSPGVRPLLERGDPVLMLAELRRARKARFDALGRRVSTDGRPPDAVGVDVLRAFEWPPPEPVADGVRLGRGALASAGRVVEALGAVESVVVVTDDRVWRLHGGALAGGLERTGTSPRPCRLEPGEPSKSIRGLVSVWDALAAAGADRDTPIVVLGGGAAGDVGGLAAATFKRGLPLALFPTTLLAQVDAAIGGKNAIDLGGIKNVVGTYHFPGAVVLDPLTLMTLDDRDWRAGWAEIVKAGLIGDPVLFALCEAEPESIGARRLEVVETAVERAVRVKARVVRDDPREAGPRRVLNLGHTLGHALESATRGRLVHGEAVAIGLVAAARLAEERGRADTGVSERIASVLSALGLPTEPPAGLDPEDLLARIDHDKKRAGGTLHLVLPIEPGQVEIEAIDDAAVTGWVRRSVA